MGKIVRAISGDGSVACCALDSTDIVKNIIEVHNSTPVVTAALGRLASACSMMGAMLKNQKDSLTLRINGGGPCGTIIAVSDWRGNVKCCVQNPRASVPIRNDGGLDVSACVGRDGFITVQKDMGLKEPYIGQVPLFSGNIAEDVTSYYSVSEQIPTVCALGIVWENQSPSTAGGFMVQIIPPFNRNSAAAVEENLKKMDSLNNLLLDGNTPEQTVAAVLSGLSCEILDTSDAIYHCGCSRRRTEEILLSLGAEEIRRLASEQSQTEVCCHFCNKKYVFSSEEMLNLLNA